MNSVHLEKSVPFTHSVDLIMTLITDTPRNYVHSGCTMALSSGHTVFTLKAVTLL